MDLSIWKTQNSRFSWYILYFLATLEACNHFHFIPIRKYRSFLKFWAPSQPRTTKTRSCGAPQSLQRIEISETSDAFWCISLKIWIFDEISKQTRNARFCRITTCDPSLESFFPELFERNKNFENILIFCFLVAIVVYSMKRNISNYWKSQI
jgi:hypothetical protein